MKKKMISLLLVAALVVGICPAAFAAPVAGEIEDPKMVDIELIITDDYGIIVSVPESKADDYRQRLENDPEFLQEEIDTALAFTKPTRYRPESRVMAEAYMYEDDIKRVVDTYAQKKVYRAWKDACDDIIKTADMIALWKTAGIGQAMAVAANALYLSINIVSAYEEAWWNESCRLICNGDISAVCYLLIESVVEYPKAWRVFERVE